MWQIAEHRRKWWVMAAMITSLSLVFIDQTAVGVALSQMQRDLNAGSTLLQWVINAYLLTLAALIILGGKLGDKMGHRKTFLLGITIFIIASVACGFATTGWWVVLSRVVQGVGGAFMIPAAVPLLFSAFASQERGKAMGIYVGISSIFLALGAPLGGMLTEWLSWRWVFWINFPLALAGIILTLKTVPESEELHPTGRMDWLGFILVGISMLCLVSGFMESATLGWTSTTIWSLLAIGVLSLVAFIRWEQSVAEPFVDLSLFRGGAFPYSTAIVVLVQGIFGIFIFWMLFILNVLAYLPAKTGLLMVPVTLPIIFMAPIGGHLRDRFGPRRPLCVGALLMFSGLLWIGLTAPLHRYAWLVPGFLSVGCAAPLIMSNCMATAFAEISATKRGIAAGIMNAARQLGGSIGITLAGTLITVLNRHALTNFLNQSSGAIAQIQESQIDGLLAKAPDALNAISHLSPSEAAAVHDAAIHAYTFAFSVTMSVMSGLALLAFFIGRRLPVSSTI